MHASKSPTSQGMRKAVVGAFAVVVALSLSLGSVALPAQAQAATTQAAMSHTFTTQAVKLVSAKAKTVNSTVKKNAKAIVKAAKATSGTSADKLEKIFAYIATDKTYGGKFSPGSYHGTYYFAAKGDNKKYYPATPRKKLGQSPVKGWAPVYKKFAVDAYKTKLPSCYHYASLFGVAAKQALGSKAVVKVGVGTSVHTGTVNNSHAWVEVKIGKTTYIYDTSAGNFYSVNVAPNDDADDEPDDATDADSADPVADAAEVAAADADAADDDAADDDAAEADEPYDGKDFGDFCGSKKTSSAMKKNYNNFKGAKYATVKL